MSQVFFIKMKQRNCDFLTLYPYHVMIPKIFPPTFGLYEKAKSCFQKGIFPKILEIDVASKVQVGFLYKVLCYEYLPIL